VQGKDRGVEYPALGVGIGAVGAGGVTGMGGGMGVGIGAMGGMSSLGGGSMSMSGAGMHNPHATGGLGQPNKVPRHFPYESQWNPPPQ